MTIEYEDELENREECEERMLPEWAKILKRLIKAARKPGLEPKSEL